MQLRIIIIIAILIVLDIYAWQAVRTVVQSSGSGWRKSVAYLFWSLSILSIAIIIAGQVFDWHLWNITLRNYLISIVFSFALFKVLLLPFLITDDLRRGVIWAAGKVSPSDDSPKITRSRFLAWLGIVIAGIPLIALIFGVIRGPYQFRVKRMVLTLPDLPAGFDGFRFVQLSDIHTGSWKGPKPMVEAVAMVNSLRPELILFTGDLVNDRALEVLPFLDVLKSLSAPMGVYSVLGNHDYGDYYQWPSVEAKEENLKNLMANQQKIGWRLLQDEYVPLQRNGDTIALAGCQNWGGRGNFTQYGDLDKTLRGLQSEFTILMSHDPSHWDGQVLGHPKKVDLMLSGHTHGMQFGLETPGFKWSPVQYFYKQWAGLYEQAGQHLYVNRGLGFIGYPGRVGIDSEITLFELRSG